MKLTEKPYYKQPWYSSYRAMMDRCYRQSAKNYCDIGFCKRYGNNSKSTHNDGNYNTCESVHAEMNAIISASRDDMLGSTLYLFGSENGSPITSEPCPVRMRLIKNAGIESVVGYKEREENA